MNFQCNNPSNSNTLQIIREEVIECKKCNLSRTRKNAVPGEGPTEASIMFIGEAPGAKEDDTGIPFVGRAGNLLEKMFSNIPIFRESVFITNIVKCRPPSNRNPLDIEIESCTPYLINQINLINPRIIVTLGKYALLHFRPTGKISEDHGKMLIWNKRILYPVYHPAAALRNKNILQSLESDLKKIPEILLLTLSKKLKN